MKAHWFFSATLLLLFAMPVQADIMYQCVDDAGHKTFSNIRSKAKGAKCIAIETGAKTADPRRGLKIGDETNLGLITEIKPPIVKVQSQDKEKWVKISEVNKLPAKK